MMFDETSRYLKVMCSFLYLTEVIRDPFSKVCTVSNTLKLTFYTCDKVYDISRFTCNALMDFKNLFVTVALKCLSYMFVLYSQGQYTKYFYKMSFCRS